MDNRLRTASSCRVRLINFLHTLDIPDSIQLFFHHIYDRPGKSDEVSGPAVQSWELPVGGETELQGMVACFFRDSWWFFNPYGTNFLHRCAVSSYADLDKGSEPVRAWRLFSHKEKKNKNPSIRQSFSLKCVLRLICRMSAKLVFVIDPNIRNSANFLVAVFYGRHAYLVGEQPFLMNPSISPGITGVRRVRSRPQIQLKRKYPCFQTTIQLLLHNQFRIV